MEYAVFGMEVKILKKMKMMITSLKKIVIYLLIPFLSIISKLIKVRVILNVFKQFFAGSYPVTEVIHEQELSLPISGVMEICSVEKVSQVLQRF